MEADMDTALRQMKEAQSDAPIELPVTGLGEVAELLREAQEDLFVPVSSAHGRAAVLTIVNDKLARARILVDVIRGDGQ